MNLLRLLPLLLVLLVPTAAAAADELTVYFFDVGQGDSALIVSPVGKTVLIDGGPPSAGSHLASRLKKLLNAPVDLIVLSHPHLDHLGGLAEAVRAVGARMFMEPNYNHPSSAYEQLLDTLKERKVELKIGEGGRNIGLGGGANLRLLWPSEPYIKGSRSDANSNSIIARLTYDQTAILFTGDAERPTEERLLSLKEDLRSNVLKVAHHGSRHTTSDDFLDKVRPEIAVISCGAGNDYGHPTREAMDRLESARAKLYRTDLDGEIVVRSDGRKVRVSTAKGGVSEPETAPVSATVGPAAPVTAKGSPGGGKTTRTAAVVNRGAGAFVGSSRSDVFHREGCSGANKIKAENLVSYKDRNDAVAAGKRPAKDCNP